MNNEERYKEALEEECTKLHTHCADCFECEVTKSKTVPLTQTANELKQALLRWLDSFEYENSRLTVHNVREAINRLSA